MHIGTFIRHSSNMLDIEIGTCDRSAWFVLYLYISLFLLNIANGKTLLTTVYINRRTVIFFRFSYRLFLMVKSISSG